ncbi:ATP-binding protein [Magnetococcus sp. PR-3]|uniref:ATP-binding protein n=1 Tax=Magnetococcus sp. PR-3 TaxID=3120355 RepID=UPI002FCE657C
MGGVMGHASIRSYRFFNRYLPSFGLFRTTKLHFLTLFFCLTFIPTAAFATPQTILLVQSYHQGFPWSDDLFAGIKHTLAQNRPDLRLRVEYLDTKQHHSAEHYQNLEELFQHKYQNNPPDLILTADDNAFDFIKRLRPTLFKAIPLVFCGLNHFTPERVEGMQPITGIVESTNFDAVVKLGLNLHPQINQVVIIHRGDTTGQANRAKFEAFADRFKKRAHFVYWQDHTLTELKKRVANLTSQSMIVSAGGVINTEQGVPISSEEGVRQLSSISQAPIYSAWLMHVGQGAVGGQILSGFSHGQSAALMGLKLLNGTPSHALPIQLESPNPYMFDHRQLVRFGISEDALPQGSTLLHRPYTVFDQYGFYIWVSVGVFLLMTLLLIIFGVNLRARQQAEASFKHLFEDAEVSLWKEDWSEVWCALQSLRSSGVENIHHHLQIHPQLLQTWISTIRVLHVNQATLKLFEAPNKSAFMQQMGITTATRNHSSFLHIMDAIWHQRPMIRVETSLDTLQGNARQLQLSFRIPTTEKGFAALPISVIDITDRKETERTLKLRQQEAEQANLAKNEFLAVMSHEIRTPLNAILGITDIVLRSELNSTQQHYMEIQGRAARSMLALIEDILDLAGIESGHLHFHQQAVVLRTLVRDVLEVHTLNAQSKGLALHVDIDEQLPAHIKGDPKRLRQVLLNLLGNAIKFTEHGHIKLEILARANHTYHMKISDTGIGIPEHKLRTIFEPFTQVDASITRQHGGAGLGLTLCKRLIQAMEGEISVDSVLGQGTTFHVILPYEDIIHGQPPSAHTNHWNIEPKNDDAASAAHILLVEDDQINQLVIEGFLQDTPHTLDIVGNGQMAVERLDHGENYTIVIMDIRMPVMNGLEATKHIRAQEQHYQLSPTPIYALTAHAMEGDAERSLRAGCNGHLTKPISRETLLAVIERHTKIV